MSELAKALAAFQAEVPTVAKGNTADAGNYKYKYADLSDVTEKVLPLLGKHGLSFSAKPCLTEDGRLVLRYVLRHVGGESDGGDYPLSGSNAQALGSAITYARRYALCAVTGVAPGGDDDDGANAKDVHVEAQPRTHHDYDPAKTEEYDRDITLATTPAELTEIGRRLGVDKRTGVISPAAYDRLVKAGAARRGELNGAAELERERLAAAASLPDNTDPS